MQSPLTGRRCLAFTITVRAAKQRADAEEAQGAPVVLRDATGVAEVDLSPARLECDRRTLEAVRWNDGDPAYDRVLERHGLAGRRNLLGGPYAYWIYERILEDDAPLAVVGVARWRVGPGGGGGPRQAARVLVLEPHPTYGLLASNEPARVGGA